MSEPDVVAFIRARLDEMVTMVEDSGDALIAWGTWRMADGSMNYTSPVAGDGDHWATGGAEAHPQSVRVVFDPARVLRQVEAIRRVVDAVERYGDPHPGVPCTNEDDTYDSCDLHVELQKFNVSPYALNLLAAIWSDHAEYQEGWQG